ncbi:2-oxo acid dehydrogenase subunit E2 [Streptomyces sp. NBC_01298]|uniref:2-oxo acid dehydrogenase subunit E2 n=1 Tax=Streptomyces sp. NBC_01298 TaxID=2903817 RepID=UPI002E13FAA0|nr:2-oxo acid dehydrogenase subunit E2 [Streptomyces sp. NBC_01298]
MIEITVPKLNNNDAQYDLVEWLAEDGATVTKDDDLLTLETSKAAEDLVSEHDGVLHQAVEAGEQVPPGAVIGRIFADAAARDAFLAAAEAAAATRTDTSGEGADFVLTAQARTQAAEFGVTEEELRSLGKRIIKGSDVEALVARRRASEEIPSNRLELSQHQRAIGAVVTESHRTVPASFTVVRMRVDAAEAATKELSARSGTAIGLPAVLITQLAALRAAFPAFFATYDEDGYALLAEQSHVGVTVDLGNGLYIPVVRDADRLSAVEVAEQLEDFRFSALRGNFRGSELMGAAITLSLNNDEDVLLTQPIIFPGQTCMVSLGGVQTGLELAADGGVVAARYVHVGLAFDHRVVNGREAVQFLQALKSALQAPELERTAEPAATAG